jgi:hypothetical protein
VTSRLCEWTSLIRWQGRRKVGGSEGLRVGLLSERDGAAGARRLGGS